jgi:transcription termination factor NusB
MNEDNYEDVQEVLQQILDEIPDTDAHRCAHKKDCDVCRAYFKGIHTGTEEVKRIINKHL